MVSFGGAAAFAARTVTFSLEFERVLARRERLVARHFTARASTGCKLTRVPICPPSTLGSAETPRTCREQNCRPPGLRR